MSLIPVATALDHLNLPADQDVTLVQRLLDSAEKHIATFTGKAFGTDTRDILFDGFRPQLELPVAPVVTINSVKYLDRNGTLQTLAPSAYVARPLGSDTVATVIYPAIGTSWPCTARSIGAAVTVNAIIGYANIDAVPDELQQAVLMLVAHWYENREAALVDNRAAAVAVPFSLIDLVAPYRRMVF